MTITHDFVLGLLDEEQRAAVLSKASQLLVVAGAGSGKTRVFVHRIAQRIADGADPSKILALSYTNAAADEVSKRLREMGIVGVQAMTLHAWCHRQPLHHFAALIGKEGYSIMAAEGSEKVLAQDMGLGERGAKQAQQELTLAKNFVEELYADHAEVVTEYDRRLAEQGKLDFDDLQVGALKLLQEHPAVLLHYRSALEHVLIDEYQDVNPIQHEILKMLCAPSDDLPTPTLTVVGDPDQSIYCQPIGTMVETVIDGVEGRRKGDRVQRPIEDLVVGDNVTTFNNGHVFTTGRSITDIERFPFEGDLVVVETADGHRSRYTPKHHCVVRVSPELRDKQAVYLMRRGNQFRIGRTPFAYDSQNGMSGLAMRGRSEKADAVWLLSLHDTKKEAATREVILQTRNMVPSLRFKASSKADVIDVDEFWAVVGDNSEHGRRLLAEHGLEEEFPIWKPGMTRGNNVGIRSPFVTAAANLVDGMTVLTADSAIPRRTSELRAPTQVWSSITVSREAYTGDIVSLTVDKHHTYFADGIMTHNSFRGSDDSFIRNFDKEFPDAERIILKMNYRSTELLVRSAERIVAKNPKRLKKTMTMSQGKGVPVEVMGCPSAGDEAKFIAWRIQQFLDAGIPATQIAVLYRYHKQAELLKEALTEADIPFWVPHDDGQQQEVGELVLASGLVLAPTPGTRPSVTLRTIHSAKGLEYHSVLLPGWSEGSIPTFRIKEDPLLIEEDRRIAYVAITRAKTNVVISYPQRKRMNSGYEMKQKASQFLDVV